MPFVRGICGAAVLALLLASVVLADPVPPVTLVDGGPIPPARPRIPCRITAGEVQRLAIAHTPLGAALEAPTTGSEPHAWFDFAGMAKARKDLLQQARHLAVEDLRNQNVGTALDLFWKLSVNLERCRLLRLARTEVATQQARLDEVIAQELKAPRDRDDLALKASRLATDELTLRAGLEQLHDQLALLIGWQHRESAGFIPASTLRVGPEYYDCDHAVAVGLDRRADIRLIRLLEANVDIRTLSIIRPWMTAINPLLVNGQIKTVIALVLRVLTALPVEEKELQRVRDQLRMLREFREKQVRSDILRNIEIVKIKHQDAVEHRNRVALLQVRLAAFQEKANKELGSAAEVSAVQLDLWRAEAELVQAAVDWELARVQLKQSQGLLTTEPVETAPAMVAPVLVPAPTLVPNPTPALIPQLPVFTPAGYRLTVPPVGYRSSLSTETSGRTSGQPGGP